MWNYWSFVKYIFPIFKLFENKYSIDYLNFFPFLSELWRIIFLSLFFFVGASLVVLDSSWVQFLRWIWILYIALSKWWLNLCFLTCPGLLRISSNVFLKSGCSSLTGEHIGSCFFFCKWRGEEVSHRGCVAWGRFGGAWTSMIYEYARYSRAKASIPLVMADYKNSFVTTNSV